MRRNFSPSPACNSRVVAHCVVLLSVAESARAQSPSYHHRAVWSIIPGSRQRIGSRPPPRASFSPPPPSDDSADSFSCSFCSKVFKARPLLKQHLSVHMENSLSCPHCGAKFRWRSTRRNHIKKFHEPDPMPSTREPLWFGELHRGLSTCCKLSFLSFLQCLRLLVR